jgi:hypothetical protein
MDYRYVGSSFRGPLTGVAIGYHSRSDYCAALRLPYVSASLAEPGPADVGPATVFVSHTVRAAPVPFNKYFGRSP